MEYINIVSTVIRAQLHIEHSAGEWVTSTLLKFDGVQNEYITTDTFAFLFNFSIFEGLRFLTDSNIPVKEKDGIQWVNACDIMPLFGWTLSP